MRTIVSFVMTKLSSKGIYQNTLAFTGRLLGSLPLCASFRVSALKPVLPSAFAFFRVDGIAQQLLTALPVSRIGLMRLQNQTKAIEASSVPPSPSFSFPLCC